MHSTVLDFARRVLRAEDVAGKRVLEVGAYDVNGTIRSIVEPLGPAEYIGTDLRPGPCVDAVVDACELKSRFGRESFDSVVSAEALEHIEDWRAAIRAMKAVLRPGGALLLTTRSWGFPLHDYPSDYWRFEVEDLGRIFGDWLVEHLERDTLVAGAFILARKPESAWEPEDLNAIEPRSMAHG